MSKKEYKYLFKIILIGSSNVGKTSIIKHYISNDFSENYQSTIGIDFYTKNLIIDENTIKLQIWDTAGLEKFRSLTKNYYKGCHACIIVFDVTNRNSFEDVFEWMNFYKENCNNNNYENANNNIILIGNKIDKTFERCVDAEDVENFCMRNNLVYYETSAKDGQNINKVFKIIGNKLYEGFKDGVVEGKVFESENYNKDNLMYSSIINNKENEKKKKFKYC